MFEKLDELTSKAGKLKVLVVSYPIYNKLKQQALITDGADLHYYKGTPIVPSDQVGEEEVYLLEKDNPLEIPFEPIYVDYIPRTLTFKGSIDKYSDLPKDAKWGEVYYVKEKEKSYIKEKDWEELCGTVDLKGDGVHEY